MRKGARGDDSNTRSLKRARAGGANKLSFGKKLVMVAPGGTATSAVMVSGAVTLEQVTRTLRAENAVVLAKSMSLEQVAVLAAVAGGVDVVHEDWVSKSLARDKVLPVERFLLEAGSGRFLLDNLRIELVGSKAFKATWGAVARHGGAKVVDRLFCDPKHIDVVVCEENRCSPNAVVEKQAAANGVPLVGTAWLVKSVRARRVLDRFEDRFAAHRTDN